MIHYKKDVDNIATLSLDMEGRSMNVINHEIRRAFVPVLKHLQAEKRKRLLKGVILTSQKPTFLAGGDLGYLYQATDPAEISRFARAMQDFLRALERPGVPVVAAINGNAIGGGFEITLACHHRIAIDTPELRLGMPEVEIGLIPGSGGIIRLMWLLGIERTFNILSGGGRYTARQAFNAGLIDQLATDRRDMLQRARHWLLEGPDSRRPWDQEAAQIPGGHAGQPEMAQRIRAMSAKLAAKTHHNFLAPQYILNVLFEGSKVDFETACQIETHYYTELVRSRTCKNMIKAFWFDSNFIKSGKNRPNGFGRFRPRKVGIIGAGRMGSGIAFSCLINGVDIVIKDVSRLIAARGKESIHKKLEEKQALGELTPEECASYLKKVQVTENPKDFETCDLVIEAVFENQAVKQKVNRESEKYLDEYSFFATNTLSIPITTLAKASERPHNYVGLHFFAPADEVPLVEIVKGSQTSEETIARAFDFVQAIQKTPIVVKDDWGFYAARVQNTYILEGITMLQEGYPPALIENLGIQSGMPQGALALADELGLDMVLNYEHQAAKHYGPKYIQHPAVKVLEVMIEDLKRPGSRKKAGFYDYDPEGKRKLSSEVAERFPEKKQPYERKEISERFLFAQVLEAIWCLQENVIHSIAAANLGSVYGWGFPSFKGGVIQYVQDYGSEKFEARCKELMEMYGQRFRLPNKFRAVLERESPDFQEKPNS